MIAQRFRGYLPVVVDVETGGFNSQTDALLEIAATLLNFDEKRQLVPIKTIHHHVEAFEGSNIEHAALEVNGIDPYNPLRNALSEKAALQNIFTEIRHLMKNTGCKRAVLVGHNAQFDLNFVNAACERNELKRNPFHPFTTLDTATLSALAYGHTVLRQACYLANIDFDDKEAHGALYDTEKTAELFCKIVNRWQSFGGWPLSRN